MDFKKSLSNSNGATLIYILAAFMIISFIGVTMIKQSHHEVKSAADFSSMTTADQAAVSGIEATKKYLEKAPDSTIKILNNFFKNRTEQWILGSNSNTIPINSQLSYRTRLISFSFDSTNYTTNFEVTIESQGFGKDNSEHSITSILAIGGLDWDDTTVAIPSNVPKNALQLDNGNFEFNTKTIINGDLSCKYKMTMNTGPFEFHGHVKIDSLEGTPKTITTTTFNKNTTIDSACYFAGPTNFASGVITFNSNVGFDGKVTSGNSSVFDFKCDTSYWNSGYISSDGNQINLGGGRAVACTSSNLYKTNNAGAHTGANVFTNITPANLITTKIDMRARLGFPTNSDPEIKLNTSLIDTIYRTINTQQWGASKLSGADLNAMYTSAESKDSLWNGFMVIRYTYSGGGGSYSPFETGGDKFEKKLIILVEDDNVRLSNFFDTDMSKGIVVLYIKDYTDNSDILNTIDNFRGFIYVEKVTANYLVITPKSHLKIDGAVYFAPLSKSKFDGGGTKTTEITFDGNVLDSIAVTNIFSTVTNNVTSKKDSIVIAGDINTTTLGMLK